MTAAALILALQLSGWTCERTQIPEPPASIVTVPGLLGWAAREARCTRAIRTRWGIM